MLRLGGLQRTTHVSIILTALLTVPLAAVAQTPAPPASTDTEVLCTVNGNAITRASLNKAVQQEWGRKILENLIEQELIFQAARTRGLTISEEEFGARLNAVKSEHESLEDFNAMMAKRGIKGPAFRQELRGQMLLDKLVKQIGKVTEDDARAYYDDHLSFYQAPERRHVHAIIAEDAEEAYQARQQVAGGADFDTVAADIGTEMAGDWEWLRKEDLRNPLIRETAFSLKPGDVSNPIFVDDEYYVLWVEEVRAGIDRSFEEVTDEIVTRIRTERGITPESVVAGLWRNAELSVPWRAYYYLEEEYEQLDRIKVTVNGKKVEMSIAPMILDNGHMLVMAKPLLGAMDAQIMWDADQQMMTAVTRAGTIQVTVGSVEARSGDRVILMKEPPQIRAGNLLISPRPVVSALGATVKWDATSYTLKVATEGAE
ncbi:MAG: peptidyl-prolyl cis-trans isomerase [Armatimonadetes bacterium]|nr:peptidyl-prolyl cis-trans isomerase [Armatimonadota bacterium]